MDANGTRPEAIDVGELNGDHGGAAIENGEAQVSTVPVDISTSNGKAKQADKKAARAVDELAATGEIKQRILLQHHRDELYRSGLTDETIAWSGIYSVECFKEVARILNRKRPHKGMAPALAIPFGGPGSSGYIRIKRDTPRLGDDGKPIKYESPIDQPNQAYTPPATPKAIKTLKAELLWTEGEKKTLAANQAGFACIGLVGVWGWKAKGRIDRLIEKLEKIDVCDRPCVIVFDSDVADNPDVRKALNRLAALLAKRGAIVKIVFLPPGPIGSDGKPAKVGLDDYLLANGRDALRALIDKTPISAVSNQQFNAITDNRGNSTNLPPLRLPGNSITITSAAKNAGTLLAKTGNHFNRGGVLVRVDRAADGTVTLVPVTVLAFCSLLETVATMLKEVRNKGEYETHASICTKKESELILAATALYQELPEIVLLSPCAVLVVRDGRLVQICDYDQSSGIFAQGKPVPDISLADAIAAFEDLLSEFLWNSPGSKSRAIASLLTPALCMGGLLKAITPYDALESDRSQAGKGFFLNLRAAIYGCLLQTVAQRSGDGVGAPQESFDSVVISGAPFINLDNLRGKFNSTAFESFKTEQYYLARIPYSPPCRINTRLFFVSLTSNQLDFTEDLVNRANIIGIKHQPDDYEFKERDGLHLFEHVQANQPRYLGAAFSIAREWYRLGRPVLPKAGHSFHQWASALGYIVEHVMGLAPLMDGHRAVQERVSTPELGWLRSLVLAVEKAGKTDQPLRPFQLLDIAIRAEIEQLASDDDAVYQKACLAVGRRIGRLLKGDTVTVDRFTFTRTIELDDRFREQKVYRVSIENPECPESTPESTPELNPENPEYPESTSHLSLGSNSVEQPSVNCAANVDGAIGLPSDHSGFQGSRGFHSGELNTDDFGGF